MDSAGAWLSRSGRAEAEPDQNQGVESV